MKRNMTIAVFVYALGLTLSGTATAAVVDPDAFAAGTEISDSFPGVTLSAVGTGSQTAAVYAVDPQVSGSDFVPSTLPHAFGHDGDVSFPADWWDSTRIFRADFHTLVNHVEIDFIANDSSDRGKLEAYNDLGQLIASDTTAILSANMFETMTVDIPGIAYILATGVDAANTGGLDHLVFVIPEPCTLSLLGLGGLYLLRCRLNRGLSHSIFGGDGLR